MILRQQLSRDLSKALPPPAHVCVLSAGNPAQRVETPRGEGNCTRSFRSSMKLAEAVPAPSLSGGRAPELTSSMDRAAPGPSPALGPPPVPGSLPMLGSSLARGSLPAPTVSTSVAETVAGSATPGTTLKSRRSSLRLAAANTPQVREAWEQLYGSMHGNTVLHPSWAVPRLMHMQMCPLQSNVHY